jgi:hypothetical protein
MTQTLLKLAADFSRQLADSVSIGDTTAELNNNTDADGNALENNKLYGFTVDKGAKKEYIVALHNNGDLTQIKNVTRQGVASTGFAKEHRIGASVEITDWAILSRVVNILDGTTDLDSATPLQYDGAPTLSDANALATVQYVLDTVSGGTVVFNPLTIQGVAGENITNGDWIYLDESDGKWYKTDADNTAKSVGVKIGKARATANINTAISGIFVAGVETVGTYVAGTTYYLSNTAGELATSAGTNSVKIGVGDQNGDLVMTYNNPDELSKDKLNALAGGGDFGTPSSSNKFVTEEYLVSGSPSPETIVYETVSSSIGSSTTQFDITNPAGTTFRYTWDSTGTDPNISLANNPIGSLINFQTQNFNAANNGLFVVTGAGTNYVEVTNASGVTESDKTIGTGYIVISGTTVWTKPDGLKFIRLRMVGGGGGGGGTSSDDVARNGGGGGGYAEKIIDAASLNSTEYFIIGGGGPGGASTSTSVGANGKLTAFGSHCYALGGIGGNNSGTAANGVNGDVNIPGGIGGTGYVISTSVQVGGGGGNSQLGSGARQSISSNGSSASGTTGGLYGGGGGGAANGDWEDAGGGDGAKGVIIIEEYS